MNRVKIELPDHFSFSTSMIIRITDLNYGGHVGNDRFLAFLQEARQAFLLHHGYEELSIAGVGLIMADAAIEFKRELNYGEELIISVKADGFDKLGFDLLYKLEVAKGNEKILAGKAKTGMLCYDYQQKKKVPVPEEVIRKLGNDGI